MKKLFLIDGMALIYRSFYAFINNPLTTKEGFPTSAIFGFLNSISKIIKEDNRLIFSNSVQKQKEIILNEHNQIIEIRNFNDGNLSEKWIPNNIELKDSIEYYGNGKIKTKGQYVYGIPSGVWTFWDRNGVE